MRNKFIFDKRSFFLLGSILILIYLIYTISFKEKFSNYNSANSFCKSNTGNKLNEKCKKLTFKNCNNTNCCVYEKNGSCVAGNQDGPLFNTDQNGKTKNTTYYFKNNCYGC